MNSKILDLLERLKLANPTEDENKLLTELCVGLNRLGYNQLHNQEFYNEVFDHGKFIVDFNAIDENIEVDPFDNLRVQDSSDGHLYKLSGFACYNSNIVKYPGIDFNLSDPIENDAYLKYTDDFENKTYLDLVRDLILDEPEIRIEESLDSNLVMVTLSIELINFREWRYDHERSNSNLNKITQKRANTIFFGKDCVRKQWGKFVKFIYKYVTGHLNYNDIATYFEHDDDNLIKVIL